MPTLFPKLKLHNAPTLPHTCIHMFCMKRCYKIDGEIRQIFEKCKSNNDTSISPKTVNMYVFNDENKLFGKRDLETGMITEDRDIQSLRSSQEIRT